MGSKRRRKKPQRRRYAYHRVYGLDSLNTGRHTQHQDVMETYRARVRYVDDQFSKLIGLDEGIPNEPRAKILKKLEAWKKQFEFGPEFSHMFLKNGNKWRLILFYGRAGAFFVQHKFGKIERSVLYTTKERAMFIYTKLGLERITFVESIASQVPAPP